MSAVPENHMVDTNNLYLGAIGKELCGRQVLWPPSWISSDLLRWHIFKWHQRVGSTRKPYDRHQYFGSGCHRRGVRSSGRHLGFSSISRLQHVFRTFFFMKSFILINILGNNRKKHTFHHRLCSRAAIFFSKLG